MTGADVILRRLRNQRLTWTTFKKAEEAVGWLGAVQAQDYAGAKWALAQRVAGLTDATVDRCFDEGRILRTHVLRPTWHFVRPADIRWMLALTGPRINAMSAPYLRRAGLDARAITRTRTILERTLRDGRHQTRAELGALFVKAGLADSPLTVGFIMMRAELDGVVCSGPRRGKQFTYALLEERVPPVRALTRDESLAALASRYFASHGPATVKDFVWWSGLTVRDAKAGIDTARPALARETVAGLTYWFANAPAPKPQRTTTAWLLPNYDEYLIAHKDRDLVVKAPGTRRMDPESNEAFSHLLVIDGLLAGIWRRLPAKGSVGVSVVPYRRLTPLDRRALGDAATRFSAFLGVPAPLTVA